MCLKDCELTLLITTIAEAFAKNLSDDEISLLGAIFVQLGDTLATISTYREVCK